MSKKHKLTILLIEDNLGDVDLIKEFFEETGESSKYDLIHKQRLREGLSVLKKGGVDVVLSDLNLPDSSHTQTVKTLLAFSSRIPIILITGSTDEKIALKAIQNGIQDYLPKGEFTSSMLLRSIRYAIEREKSNAHIRQVEQQLTSVVNNAPIVVWTIDTDGIFQLIEGKGLESIGTKPGESVGKSIFDVYKKSPEIIHAVKDALHGTSSVREVSLYDCWYETFYTPIYDKKNKVIGAMGVWTDVTDRKEIETSLQESEQRFRSMADNIPNLAWMAKADGYIYWFNRRWYEYTGTTAEDMRGWGWKSVHDQEMLPIVMKRWKASIRSGKPFDMVFPIKGGDGVFRPFLTRIMPVRDEHGTILHWFGTNTDISQQSNLQQELRDKTERLLLSQKAGKIGTFEWDIVKNVNTWSKELEHIYHIPEGSFKGTYDAWSELVHVEDRSIISDKVTKLLKNKKHDFVAEWRIYSPIGIRYISARAQFFYDKKGNPLRMVGVNMDITEQKELERQKENFLGIASHELKTPVTSIKAYAQVLLQLFSKKGDTNAVNQLKKMDLQINKLTNLISDLLDVTKIQAGKLQMNKEKFSVNELIYETVEELQRTSEKHTIETDLSRNYMVYGDKERIGQVLTNLITNAIKYSPDADSVCISTKLKDGKIHVCIRDFGVGIPDDKKEQVFDQFYRVTGSKRDTFPGLGLGLYISKQIINRSGGDLWVEPVSGKGSSFCFTLPKHS